MIGTKNFMTSTPMRANATNNNEDFEYENEDEEFNLDSKHEENLKFMTLEDVFNQYPLEKSSITVSIYAIIQSYDIGTNVLTVMDETRKQFKIYAELKKTDSKRLPTRSGDIVRINQLRLFSDYTRRCNLFSDNIMIFESFRDERFKPIHVSNKEPKFDDYARKRVDELIHFNVKSLLEAEIRMSNENFHLVDTAFQVLCTFKYENRIIIACWNGKSFDDYPCMQLIKIQQIIDTLNSISEKSHVYTESYLKKIYEEKKIAFVSVYGLHRVVAITLKPLDTIVIYNLLIKPDKFYFGHSSFILYDGLKFGRTIRTVDNNSELAIELRSQIEKKSIFSDSFDVENFLSDQTINDDNQENEEISNKVRKKDEHQRSVSFFFSDTLDDSVLNDEFHKIPCTHYQYDIVERELIHRHFYSCEDKSLPNAIRIKSFLEMTNAENNESSEERFFQIEAKFHSILFCQDQLNIFESMKTLRKYSMVVECTSVDSNCDYQDTYENFMKKSTELYHEYDGQLVCNDEANSTISDDCLECPKCHKKSCILCLNFILVLNDFDNDFLMARLCGNNANVFFSCTTLDLCSNSSDIPRKISSLFKHMNHITNHQTECIQTIAWTLTFNGQQTEDEREYQVVNVSVIRKSIFCGIKTDD